VTHLHCVAGKRDAPEKSQFIPEASSLLRNFCKVSTDPIADRRGHPAKIFPLSELVIGAGQEIQSLGASQRIV
jgi:hypothetical protein